MEIYEILQLIFAGCTAVSGIAIFIQIYLTKKQLRDSHEESRRTKTIELMLEWSRTLERETSFAETIVESLNHKQSKALFEKEPFSVDNKCKRNICEICKEDMECNGMCQTCDKNEPYVVKDLVLSELRWYVITYLNMLESILAAWHLGIVDRDTIEEQFAYLYNPEKGYNVLEDFEILREERKLTHVLTNL